MTPAAGPFAIAALLLALAGASKALSPSDTSTALRSLGLPAPPLAVRVAGAAEAVLGVVAVLSGDRISAALVAASYLAFAVFVIHALRRDAPLSTCGCFGGVDTPPSLVHVGVNLGAAVAALAVIVDPGVGLVRTLEGQPLAGVPYVFLVLTGVFVAYLAITSLPRTLTVARATRSA